MDREVWGRREKGGRNVLGEGHVTCVRGLPTGHYESWGLNKVAD